MKKNKLPLRLVSGIIMLLIFSTASAKKIKVKSPGNHKDIQPAIQAAVDKAVNGDLIILPEGEFIINKGVIITKFISFKGKGLKKTVLYRDDSVPDSILSKFEWRSMFFFNINSDVSSNIVVSGIAFKARKPMVKFGDGGSRASSEGIRMYQCVDFLIERCRFEYFGNAGIYAIHNDTLARGLIRKNEFYYNARAGLGYGVAVIGSDETWVKDPKFGSSNFIFVEDNVFDFHRHSIAAGGGGLYVFRHNVVLNNTVSPGGHAVDTHEARRGSGNTFGTRAVEVYDNKLINTTYTDGSPIIPNTKPELLEGSGIGIRAGDAVVYNNEVKGYRYAISISNWYREGTIQSFYPILDAPGYLSGLALGPEHSGTNAPQGDGDAFFWNNTSSPFGTEDSLSLFRNAEPSWWKEGRDYHFVPKPGYKPYPYPYPIAKKKK